MKDDRKEPTWHQAKQALSHPDRMAMLAQITGSGFGAGARELAEALGLPVVKVDYHLLVLHNADLIAPTGDAGRYIAIAPGPQQWAA